MGEVILFIPKDEVRIDKHALASHFNQFKKLIPYLERHLLEVTESPTNLHKTQTLATIGRIRETLDYLTYYLTR